VKPSGESISDLSIRITKRKRGEGMKLNIFCAECGTSLELAASWKPPLQRGPYNEHQIPLKPCPICANKNRGAKIAIDLLEKTLAEATKEKEG
jgi:hypothetical protein